LISNWAIGPIGISFRLDDRECFLFDLDDSSCEENLSTTIAVSDQGQSFEFLFNITNQGNDPTLDAVVGFHGFDPEVLCGISCVRGSHVINFEDFTVAQCFLTDGLVFTALQNECYLPGLEPGQSVSYPVIAQKSDIQGCTLNVGAILVLPGFKSLESDSATADQCDGDEDNGGGGATILPLVISCTILIYFILSISALRSARASRRF
ncbi:MAG: hypothetical protein MJA83_20500, partial [Gammaproteobacteria bacterium]|nr:hypothetical protein [Gammaproteobacteria bacterium]